MVLPIPKKSAPVIIIVVLLILAAVFVIPSSGDTVKTAFGQFRVEIITNDCCGNTMMMQPSSITSQLLEFTKDGATVEEVTVNIYATATGNGFNSCELDFSENTPKIQYSLNDGNIGSVSHNVQSLDNNIPLNTEKKIFSDVLELSDLISGNPDSQTMSLDIMFNAPDVKFRGISSDGEGPWETTDASFTVQSNIQLIWEHEDSCGDGSCISEPYPGENCMSCPEDCGSCNGRIRPGDRSYSVENSNLLYKDSWDIQRTYDTGSGWSDWSQGNTNWEHVEIFEYNNNFCAYVWPQSGAIGATLNGQCRMRPIYNDGSTGSWFNLPEVQASWNDLGKTITSSDGVSGYWETDSYQDHLLIHNGKYEMDIYYWLDGDSPSDVSVEITNCPGNIDTGFPFVMKYMIESSMYDTATCVDTYWRNPQTGSMFGLDTRYNVDIGVEQSAPSQTFVSGFDGPFAEFHVCVEEPQDYFATDSCTVYIDQGLFQMVSDGLFSIVDSNTDFEEYEYNGKTLGG